MLALLDVHAGSEDGASIAPSGVAGTEDHWDAQSQDQPQHSKPMYKYITNFIKLFLVVTHSETHCSLQMT